MKILAIIQARYGSTRLPGKVLLPLGKKSVLEHVVDRAKKIEGISHVIVATGDRSRNYFITEECNRISAPIYYYHDEADVLLRFLFCAMENRADYVLRITGDSPFLDISLANELIENKEGYKDAFDPQPNEPRQYYCEYDYIAHYKPKESNPTVHKYAWGCMTELIKTDALYAAQKEADGYDREHVTSYIYNHPQKYKIKRIEIAPPYPLTVSIDDEVSYAKAKKIIKAHTI